MALAEHTRRMKELLQLQYEPVGVSGANPTETSQPNPSAPSACTFWRRAESKNITADAREHANCKVGAHVMGFSLENEDMAALGHLIETMVGVSYILTDEVPALPRLPENKAWNYRPLNTLEFPPELAILWVDGRQLMLIQEAMGSAHWKSGKGLRTTGRPACGALALAYHNAQVVLSFGCAGMRTFTEIPDHLMLLVLPGELIEGLCRALEQTRLSNLAVQCVYDQQKELFT